MRVCACVFNWGRFHNSWQLSRSHTVLTLITCSSPNDFTVWRAIFSFQCTFLEVCVYPMRVMAKERVLSCVYVCLCPSLCAIVTNFLNVCGREGGDKSGGIASWWLFWTFIGNKTTLTECGEQIVWVSEKCECFWKQKSYKNKPRNLERSCINLLNHRANESMITSEEKKC